MSRTSSLPRPAILWAFLLLSSLASASAASVAAERPGCADGGPAPEALCACLIQECWREAGSPPDLDLSRVDCSVETYEPGIAVVAVGTVELYEISYFLALRTGDSWTAVARIGAKELPSTGGHYSDFEMQEVRVIERGAARLLWVQSRESAGHWHFDGSEGSHETVRVTLCMLPVPPDHRVACPVQVPILIDSSWTDPRDAPADGEEEAAEEAAEADVDGVEEDDPELDGREHEETTRLEIRISADGATAEVVLLEGELSTGQLRDKLGVHSLGDE